MHEALHTSHTRSRSQSARQPDHRTITPSLATPSPLHVPPTPAQSSSTQPHGPLTTHPTPPFPLPLAPLPPHLNPAHCNTIAQTGRRGTDMCRATGPRAEAGPKYDPTTLVFFRTYTPRPEPEPQPSTAGVEESTMCGDRVVFFVFVSCLLFVTFRTVRELVCGASPGRV